MNKLQYWILEAPSLLKLMDEVQEDIDEGWLPLGGVSVVCAPELETGFLYTQAMTREEK
jgi:Domain of unknown function (DUF1737)